MQVISVFSGIGGFELAASWMGWENVVSCEINPFGRQVLEYYWPEAYHHDDIRTLSYETIIQKSKWKPRGPTILVGGFPCQPYSSAGKRLGKEDERHLWPEMLRLICEVSPDWVVGENVRGLTNWNGGLVFDEVQADLEAAGYEVIPFLLPAGSVNAPHRRDRIWFIAYADRSRHNRRRQRQDGKFTERKIRENLENDGFEVRGQTSACSSATTDTNSNQRTPGRKQYQQQRKAPFANGGSYAGNSNCKHEGSEQSVQSRTSTESERVCNAISPNSDSRQCKTGVQSGFATDSTEKGTGINNRPTRYGYGIPRSDWTHFPTQPPVCRRDDGISTGLSGITLSKHRTESIKAYGNAIVPQVVYQIFKAIEEYGNIA